VPVAFYGLAVLIGGIATACCLSLLKPLSERQDRSEAPEAPVLVPTVESEPA
jgi:hypothetical protein